MDIVEQIERIVDANNLLHVVTALELMCTEKAEHLRCNWQDENAAKTWERAARVFGAAATKIEPLEL
jgi:hypothetical protein